MMVRAHCAHQRAPGARGTKRVASLRCPLRAHGRRWVCRKGLEPQGQRGAWPLKTTSRKTQRLPKHPSSLQARQTAWPQNYPVAGIFSNWSIWLHISRV